MYIGKPESVYQNTAIHRKKIPIQLHVFILTQILK